MHELQTQGQSIMRAMRHGWRRGQTAVEVAIAAPMLAVLLVACADFGRIFYTNVEVDNAARAGAQYGSQSVTAAANSTNIQTAAINGAPNLSGLTVTSSTCTCVTPTPSGENACASSYCTNSPNATYVTVNTQATYHTILKYPGLPSTSVLPGTAIMQVQQ